MKFECIKGIADRDNINVVVMQGDVVTLNYSREELVGVEGVAGWCKGHELIFTPKKFVECFKVIGISYVL